MHSSVTKRPDGARFAAPRDRMPRGRRSARYIVAIHRFDRVMDHASRAVATVMAEFGPSAPLPLSVVAPCSLGMPFATHALDLAEGTVRHHEEDEPLPPLLERARELAFDPAHLAIEVYAGWLVCVREDGSTVAVD